MPWYPAGRGAPHVAPAVRTRAAILSSTAALAQALLFSVPAEAVLPPAASDEWIEVTTARFHVYSNAGERAASHTARHLERLAEAIQRTTSGLRVDGGRENRVYLFRDRASYAPYSPFRDDEYSTTPGYHVAGEDVEYIAFYLPAGDTPMRVASHEYAHIVLSQSWGHPPLWINEGLAEFYSTFQARREGADIGRPIPEHVAWLKQHMFTMREILLAGGGSPDYVGGQRRQTIYAQSWALVHTLVMDTARPRAFGALMTELWRGASGEDAIRRTYGPNALDSLQSRLREITTLVGLPYSQWKFGAEAPAPTTRVRALDRAEAVMVLGDLLAHTSDRLFPSAREHLVEAWHADSTRALTAALLGELADRQGDHGASTAWFERVDDSPRGEPRALGIAGGTLLRRRLASPGSLSWPAAGAGADERKARARLDRALAERPDDAIWLALFGLTFLDDSEGVHEGIGALLRAQEAWPHRTDIFGALSILSLRAGNRGAALAMYRRIPAGPDRGHWRHAAGWLLVRHTYAEIRYLMEEGRFAAAESLVVELRGVVTEAGVSAECDRMVEWIRGRVPSPTPAAPAESKRPRQLRFGPGGFRGRRGRPAPPKSIRRR